MHYDSMRHLADSWGLVYLFGIFLMVLLMMVRPGAREKAHDAALIPLRNDEGSAKP